MIDYVDTEIITYVDSNYYPDSLVLVGSSPDFIVDRVVRVQSDGSKTNGIKYLYDSIYTGVSVDSRKLLAVQCVGYVSYNGSTVEYSEFNSVHYYKMGVSLPGSFTYSISYVDYSLVPQDVIDKYSGGILPPVPSGSDIYFLYNFGSNLVTIGSNFLDIFTFKAFGVEYNLLSLFFTSGFAIYVAWVIVKFFLPL